MDIRIYRRLNADEVLEVHGLAFYAAKTRVLKSGTLLRTFCLSGRCWVFCSFHVHFNIPPLLYYMLTE